MPRCDDSIEELLSNLIPAGKVFFLGNVASRALARALEKIGITRALGFVAHHIVAWEAARAEPARLILDRFKIKLNDAPNETFLLEEVHRHLHKNRYYDAVNAALAEATTKAEAEQILKAIADALQAGTFPGMLP